MQFVVGFALAYIFRKPIEVVVHHMTSIVKDALEGSFPESTEEHIEPSSEEQ